MSDQHKVRDVYLPDGVDWHDFWTGAKLRGGQTIAADAPLETMPLYVRAGSIDPMGPFVQHTDEAPGVDWTILVYPGADAHFTVYEDSGDGYAYEKNEFATWNLNWNDANSTLSIGKREGSFPGMLESSTLNIVMMGQEPDDTGKETPAKTIIYSGKMLVCRVRGLELVRIVTNSFSP